jgi:hypothetical protein
MAVPDRYYEPLLNTNADKRWQARAAIDPRRRTRNMA